MRTQRWERNRTPQIACVLSEPVPGLISDCSRRSEQEYHLGCILPCVDADALVHACEACQRTAPPHIRRLPQCCHSELLKSDFACMPAAGTLVVCVKWAGGGCMGGCVCACACACSRAYSDSGGSGGSGGGGGGGGSSGNLGSEALLDTGST